MSSHSHTDIVKTFTLEERPHSTVLVTGEIPFEVLQEHESHVLPHMGAHLEIKGFRKGHVPESVIRKHIGELSILSEVAEHVLAEIYPEVLKEFKLDAIGRPQVNITKLAPGNPFGFTLEIALLPKVSLPDYVSIAQGINAKKESVEVTEKDVAEAIERVQRQKLAYDNLQEKARKRQAAEEAQKNGLTLPTPETAAPEGADEDVSKLPVPELTDEYVKTLGGFASVEDFKTQIQTHLVREKKEEAESKHRGALTDALVEATTIELPQLLIDSELNQMFGQMEDDLKRAGLTIDGYLEHVKKTKEDLVKEWTPAAERRAKTQLVLNAISDKEHIEPQKEDVEREMASLLAQYKDADALRVRIYVESVLRNSEVMKFLETR